MDIILGYQTGCLSLCSVKCPILQTILKLSTKAPLSLRLKTFGKVQVMGASVEDWSEDLRPIMGYVLAETSSWVLLLTSKKRTQKTRKKAERWSLFFLRKFEIESYGLKENSKFSTWANHYWLLDVLVSDWELKLFRNFFQNPPFVAFYNCKFFLLLFPIAAQRTARKKLRLNAKISGRKIRIPVQ